MSESESCPATPSRPGLRSEFVLTVDHHEGLDIWFSVGGKAILDVAREAILKAFPGTVRDVRLSVLQGERR